MCGAENCRGFIGKRKALPPPRKQEIVKRAKTVVSKVKRVIQGRITKRSKKQVMIKRSRSTVKATVKNRKRVDAFPDSEDETMPKTKARKMKLQAKVQKAKKTSTAKKTTMLGKRKRSDSTEKKGKSKIIGSPRKGTISGRKIAKPRPKLKVGSPKSRHARPIYDTVSHRSRKRNVR
jgi:hypothetical protein